MHEALERGLHRYRAQIKTIRLPVPSKGETNAPVVRARRADRVKRAEEARTRAVERYQAVRQLALENVPHLHIARRLHVSRSTVIRYAKAEQFPERPHHPPRPGVLTPYEPYLYARWKEGQVKAVPLFREIVAQGYRGSRMSVQRYILGLRQQPSPARQAPVLSATVEMTPHRVVGLLLQPADALTEPERTALTQVRTLHPQITCALSLFEDFHQMLLTRHGEALPNWMAAAFHCGLPKFRAFVNKLHQDQQAVQTGLVLHLPVQKTGQK